MFQITDTVKHLLILNILVFLLTSAFPVLLDQYALYYIGAEGFMPIQLVSHFFMHFDTTHIFFNMFTLAVFGPKLEIAWGPRRFLMFYILCAFGALLLQMGWYHYQYMQMVKELEIFKSQPSGHALDIFLRHLNLENGLTWEGNQIIGELRTALDNGSKGALSNTLRQLNGLITHMTNAPRMAGASGAIMGVVVAYGIFFPNDELMLLFLPIPIKAAIFIPILVGIDLIMGIGQFQGDNVARWAHLGGALIGGLIAYYWKTKGSTWKPW